MSMLLWTDEEADEAIDLGDPFLVYQAFAEMAKLADGDDGWEILFSVPGFAEEQVDSEWLLQVREQAKKFLREHGDLSDHAQWILRKLTFS